MILVQPVILAGEFFNHAVAIVLLGTLLAEYLMPREELGTYAKRRKTAIALLLLILGVGLAMILFEFFIGRGRVWPNLVIHIPGISLIVYLLFRFRRRAGVPLPETLFFIMITSVLTVLTASTLYIFVQHHLVILTSTLAQLASLAAFFVYIHIFLVSKPEDSE